MDKKNDLCSKVKAILAEKLNEFIIDSIIRVNCKNVEIDPKKIDVSNLDEIAEKIGTSLLLFLSEEEAAEMVKKIKEIK